MRSCFFLEKSHVVANNFLNIFIGNPYSVAEVVQNKRKDENMTLKILN